MARVQVAADALHLKPTRLRVLSSYERTSGYALDYLSTPPPLSPSFPVCRDRVDAVQRQTALQDNGEVASKNLSRAQTASRLDERAFVFHGESVERGRYSLSASEPIIFTPE